MGTEGWYNDEADPALARWYDGTGWTRHTMVKAEWAGPGEPPPPDSEAWFVDGPEVDRHDPALYATVPGLAGPGSGPALDARPTATIDGLAPEGLDHEPSWDPGFEDRAADEVFDDEGFEVWGGSGAGAAGTDHSVFDPEGDYEYGGYPSAQRTAIDWSRFAAPLAGVAALVIALLAIQLVGGDDDPDPATQETSAVADIDAALDRARQGLAVEVTDGDLKALIRGLCDVAGGGSVGPVAGDAAIAVDDPAALPGLMAAAARGAAEYCPADTAQANGAVDDVVAAASTRISTTTLPPVDTTPPAADEGASGSAGSSRARTSGSSSATSTGSSRGGVQRTESRQQTSTNPTGLSSSSGSPDAVTDVGNQGGERQITQTTVTAPATTTTAAASESPPPADSVP